MNRRDLLTAIAASGTLASLSTSVAANDVGDRTIASRSHADEFERDDWVPHHTLNINQDATARLRISLEGSNAPNSVTLNSRRTTVLEIVEGDEALSSGKDRYTWDVEQANSVAFRLKLGENSRGGLKTAGFENSIASNLNETIQVNQWPAGSDSLPKAYRFTFAPPAEWSVVSPGERVGTKTYDLNPGIIQYGSTLKDLFAVGDFEVHEREAGSGTIRYAQLPEADHQYAIEEAVELILDTTPVIESIYGPKVHYPWAVIFVPSDVDRGGMIQDHSIFMADDDPLIGGGGSTLTTELAGLHTRAIRCSGDRCSGAWYIAGAKSWIGRLNALYATDRVDHEGLRGMLRAWITGSNDARDHEDPLRVPATDSPVTKGTAINVLLDMEIRARTDGHDDIGAWLSQIADQRILQYQGEGRSLISDEEARPLLYDITGVDYTKFYERIVHGSEFPENFVEEVFSIENPWPVYAAFEYPSIEVPNQITVDESAEVTIEMRNDAERPQARTVNLVVDGEGVAATDVQLDPGEGTTVTLEHTFTSPGEYVVRVPPAFKQPVMVQQSGQDESNPGDTGEANPSTDATASPGQPGFGILSTLSGVGGAIGYSKLRIGTGEE